jgi:hypothetical protein
MENEIKPLILALTKLVADLASETASLMYSDAERVQLQPPHLAAQRKKARHIRETGQQVLQLCEQVLGE